MFLSSAVSWVLKYRGLALRLWPDLGVGCWTREHKHTHTHTHKAISAAVSPFRKTPQCKFGSGSAEAGHGINSEIEKIFLFLFFFLSR